MNKSQKKDKFLYIPKDYNYYAQINASSLLFIQIRYSLKKKSFLITL